MSNITTVTDSTLMQLQEKSNDPIYVANLAEVVDTFSEKHPDRAGLNGLKMRAILAGDVEIVDISGKRKFALMLTSEILELDKLNNEIRAKNREIRETNIEQARVERERIKDMLIDLEIDDHPAFAGIIK